MMKYSKYISAELVRTANEEDGRDHVTVLLMAFD